MSVPGIPGGTVRWPLQYLSAAGPHAGPVVGLNWYLLILSCVVTLIFTVAVVWGVIARRQASSEEALSTASIDRGTRGLRWIYVGMPLTLAALVVALFWTMFVMARIAAPARPTALTLTVTGRQWWWQVNYPATPGGRAFETANEIHIPVGQPVLVRLRGGDVIHSFWVPALAGKTDTIPGRENVTWLQADRPGTYRGQCTEYCGLQHANMGFLVIADPPAAFAQWRRRHERMGTGAPSAEGTMPALAAAASAAPRAPVLADRGAAVFDAHCGMCHAIDGTAAQGHNGPNLTHLMDRRTIAAVTLSNTVNNLGGWISDPQAQKPGALMPATKLSGPELQAVIAYLRAQR